MIGLYKKYLLEIIVFTIGAVVMILELVGSRVLAPFLGTSIFVWTSLIGIILGSLSVGYWIGGKMADKNANYPTFAAIIFAAGILVALDALVKTPFLSFLSYFNDENIRINSIIATLVLFTPVNILLGIISPYAIKLKMKDLNNSGATVGNLYAISTIGSITGTFLAGFFLISYLGDTKILLLLSSILAAASIAAFPKNIIKTKIILFSFVAAIIPLSVSLNYPFNNKDFINVDTLYNKVWIYSAPNPWGDNKKTVKIMKLNNEPNSAMFIDDEDLVFEYTKFYRMIKHFNPDLKSALMIGGGAYSYPKDYLKKFPGATLDVVEIDPELTALSKKYFNLKDDPRLNIFHEDGRIFLNGTKNKYDAIFSDAFVSKSIPYNLTTKEAIQKMYDSLNVNGSIMVNIISSTGGEKSKFLRAEYATYQSIFPQVYLFTINLPSKNDDTQNIMLLALKSAAKPAFTSNDPEINGYLGHLLQEKIETDLPILTDDYAPVDQYMMEMI